MISYPVRNRLASTCFEVSSASFFVSLAASACVSADALSSCIHRLLTQNGVSSTYCVN